MRSEKEQNDQRTPPPSAWLLDSGPHPTTHREPSEHEWSEEPVEYWEPANRLPQFAEDGIGEMQPPDERGQEGNISSRRSLRDTLQYVVINGTPAALGVIGAGYGWYAVKDGNAVFGAISAVTEFFAGVTYEAGRDFSPKPPSEQ